MTPPNVLGAPNPQSSVMISRMFGGSLGGTMRGAHHALDWLALSLITPLNFGSGAGSCLPLIVVVAPGEPGVSVVYTWVLADGATAMTAAANIPQRNVCLADFIGFSLIAAARQLVGVSEICCALGDSLIGL